jgi:hypothetical protein
VSFTLHKTTDLVRSSTADNLHPDSTLTTVDKAVPSTVTVATTTIGGAIKEIAVLVAGATHSVHSLGLAKRQLAGDLTAIVATLGVLLAEVIATLDTVVAELGLTGLLVDLAPLELALGGLLASLLAVVDGLLVAVGNLLDNLLTGLSGIGLGGLLGSLGL